MAPLPLLATSMYATVSKCKNAKLLADRNNQQGIYGAKSITQYCKHPSTQINVMQWILSPNSQSGHLITKIVETLTHKNSN